jgi:hypothetical protein
MCKICTRPFAFSFAFVRVRKPLAVSYSTIAHAKFRAASPSYPNYRASALFNHVVGDREQRRGHVEAEGSCGLEVDAQLGPGRELYRQVARFLSFENAIDIAG